MRRENVRHVDLLVRVQAGKPAEHRGRDGQQREGRQDAGDEGEAEANGNGAGARLRPAPHVGAYFVREPSERGGGR